MRALRRILVPAAAAALLAGGVAAPASANQRTFKDGRDAPASIDIRKVRVENDKLIVVLVKTRRPMALGDSVTVYFDTLRKRRGPEFSLAGRYGSEYTMVRRKSWTKSGRAVDCRPYRLKIIANGNTRATVARKCLGRPGRIRVAVHLSRRGPGADWARAKHRWLGGVRR